jgi:hypothetical protein
VPGSVLTEASRVYRSLVIETCAALKAEGALSAADLYTNLDFVWNFVEIIFLASHPGKSVRIMKNFDRRKIFSGFINFKT